MELFDKWMNLKLQYRYFIVGIVIVFIMIGISFLYICSKPQKSGEIKPVMITKTTEEEVKKIQVDVKGAVVNPGVYSLNENSNVKEAIEKSGGLKENADTTYINLSKKLKDEMVIIIYTMEEINAMKEGKENIVVVEGKCVCPNITNDGCIQEKDKVDNTGKASNSQNDTTQIINLNTATIEQLQTLSGIGASKARDIIAYREEHGGFQSISEITEVKGIGTATFEKIKDRLTIS